MALNAAVLLRLCSIFEKKKWAIQTGDPYGDRERFDTFCEMLDKLSPTEIQLLLDLTENFEKFDPSRSAGRLTSAFRLIDQSLIQNASEIFVFPLLSPQDNDKNKSGSVIAYQFQHAVLRPCLKWLGLTTNVYGFHSLESLNNHAGRNNALLFVADDFIGTGDTADQFIDAYELGHKVASDTLIFLSIAAMPRGIDHIKHRGHRIHTALIQSRGISDSIIIDACPTALDMMDAIEARLDVDGPYRRGFQQSEALISFIRTPDNTFPVYWTPKAADGEKWPAPFPR